MSFLLYLAVCFIYAYLCGAVGVEKIGDTDWIILAVLTGAEVISWRCKK